MAMEDRRPQPPVRPPGQSEVLPQELTRSHMVETGNARLLRSSSKRLMLTTGKAWNDFLMPNTCGKCRGQANAFAGWQTTERRMRTTQGCPTLRLIGSPGARTSGSRRPALRFSRSLVRVTTTRRSQSPPTRMGAYGTRSTFSTSVQERSSTTSPTSRPPWKLLSGGPDGWNASKAFHWYIRRNLSGPPVGRLAELVPCPPCVAHLMGVTFPRNGFTAIAAAGATP